MTCATGVILAQYDTLASNGSVGKIKKSVFKGWRRVVSVLDRHTDIISSVSVLAITTCLCAAKIFSNTPPIIPRAARVILNVGGIIWLNVQIKDCLKSFDDLKRTFYDRELDSFFKTAIKVFVKTVDVFLTCAYFASSVAAFAGFPLMSAQVYVMFRPLSLAGFAMQIISDIGDYFTNESLLKKLNRIEELPDANRQLAKIMRSYLRITTNCHSKEGVSNEKKLASNIVRQLDAFSLGELRSRVKQQKGEDARIKAITLYFNIKDGLTNTQAAVRSNLCLRVLGYASMGICRMYPDSLKEMLARWIMSVLYTDALITYKLTQMDLIQAEIRH